MKIFFKFLLTTLFAFNLVFSSSDLDPFTASKNSYEASNQEASINLHNAGKAEDIQKSEFNNNELNNFAESSFLDELLKQAAEEGLTWDELFSIDSVEEPSTYEATIKAYDPSKPKSEDQDLSWSQILEEIFNEELDDESLFENLDQENLNLLLEDWMDYIKILSYEFFENKDEIENKNFLNSIFKDMDKDLQKSLLEKEITNIDELIEKSKEQKIDQELLFKAIDSITFSLEEKIVENFDEKELNDKLLNLIKDLSLPEEFLELFLDSLNSDEKTENTENFFDSQGSEKANMNEINDYEIPSDFDVEDIQLNEIETNQNELNQRVSSCYDFKNDRASCEQLLQCKCQSEDSSCNCTVSPDHMSYLVNTGCKKEPKANILSVARDLFNEGYMDAATLAHLQKLQDNNSICRAVTHTYFSTPSNRDENLEEDFKYKYDSAQWSKLSPKEKLNLIMSVADTL